MSWMLLALAGLNLQLDVTLNPAFPDAPRPAAVTVRWVARPISGEDAQEGTAQVRFPGHGVLAIAVPSTVEVRVDAPGLWFPVLRAIVRGEGTSLAVQGRPLRLLRGRAQPTPVGELRVLFRHPGAEQAGAELRGEVSVKPAPDGRFDVRLPAGIWDLRFSTHGRAPRYLWNADVTSPLGLDLGTVNLPPGASLSGFVVDEARRPLAGVELVLEPAVDTRWLNQRDAQRVAAQQRHARTNDHGFFQFFPLPAGHYRLQARAEGLAPETAEPLPVEEGAETQLAEPLVLHRPVPVEVVVAPPADPWGAPFRVEMDRLLPTVSGTFKSKAAEQVVDSSGVFKTTLAPGSYRLIVSSEPNHTWLEEDLEVSAPVTRKLVELRLIKVDGRLRVGDQTTSGEVCLVHTTKNSRICEVSDESGRFALVLPHAGEWTVTARIGQETVPCEPLEIPEGKDKLQWELVIPDTRLEGTVVNDEGAPVEGAKVWVAPIGENSKKRSQAETTTGADGTFVLRGLKPGLWLVSARALDAESDGQIVEVPEGGEPPRVQMVVSKSVLVRGRVRYRGQPVAGATVLLRAACFSRGATQAVSLPARTGILGTFETRLRLPCPQLNALVSAPGFPLLLRRVVAGGEGELALDLEDEGGTLIIVGEPKPALGGWVLVHRGAYVSLPSLLPLMSARTARTGDLQLENLEPGTWALCPAQVIPILETLPQGADLVPEGCTRASVFPGGTAQLRFPAQPAP